MTKKEFIYFIAFQEKALIRRGWPRVGDHAEDVFQETITSFLTPGEDGQPGYSKYPGPPNMMFVQEMRKTFFFRMVDYIRNRNKGAWQGQVPLFDDYDLELSAEGPDVAYEEYEWLRELPLWRLTDIQLVTLDLRYGHGLTEQAIADAHSVSQPSVHERLGGAITTLREWVGRPHTVGEKKFYQAQVELLEGLWTDRGTLASVLPALIQALVVLRGPSVAIDHPGSGLEG